MFLPIDMSGEGIQILVTLIQCFSADVHTHGLDTYVICDENIKTVWLLKAFQVVNLLTTIYMFKSNKLYDESFI